MVQLNVSPKRQVSVLGVVGKGVFVGMLFGASALTQASALTSQSAYVDGGSCGSASGARHGGSRPGCSVEINEQFSESSISAGRVQVTFMAPPNFSGATSAIFSAPLAGAKPALVAPVLAPAVINPAALLPLTVAPPAVLTQQVVAAAPPVVVVPTTTVQPVGPAAPQVISVLPVPSISVLSVPEPGTVALMLGGFIALIGIRRKRAHAK